MGGVVGATTGKFVIVGAALLLQGRVDDVLTTLAIVPGAEVSAISPTLADRLQVHHQEGQPYTIRIRRENFTAQIGRNETNWQSGVTLRIGADLLAKQLILIDFKHRSARILMRYEISGMLRHFARVPLSRSTSGTWLVAATGAGGQKGWARLNLSTTVFAVQGAEHKACLREDGEGTGELSDEFGLPDFKDSAVVFDFDNRQIWISREKRGSGPLC